MKFNKSIIGMIHLAGPDTVDKALQEIEIYEKEGLQGIIVENYHGSIQDIHDVLQRVKTKMDIGINILPNDYVEAFQIAKQYGATFIQLDFISGTYEKNQSIDFHHYLSFRNKYPNISVLGGVWPKYYVPVKGSSLEEDLKMGMKLCDAIVVTGPGTGKETPLTKINHFRSIIGKFPLIIGAGLNIDNINQLEIADGAIVGSAFKPDSNTTKTVDSNLVSNFMIEKLRL